MSKKILATVLFLLTGCWLMAQDAAAINTAAPGNNLLATFIIIIAIVLLFVLWGMGQALTVISRQLLDKNKAASKMAVIPLLLILSLVSQNILAEDTTATEAVKSIPNYGGLSATLFYSLLSVISIEVIAILFLFFCIRKIYAELVPDKITPVIKVSKLATLFKKLNNTLTHSIPIEQEEDALLDHDYDGIKELDNALPPWWKYGFIITIGFAILYLVNFHLWGNGKNPTQEYAAEIDNARIEKEAYEAKNKDKIDESNVPMADVAGIQRGQEFFLANCVACHGPNGGGGAGPNLTDDYWLHKGSLNDIYNTIKKGYPDKGMQSWAIKFNPKEISELASYVITLKGTNPPGGKAPQGDLFNTITTTDSFKKQAGKPGNNKIKMAIVQDISTKQSFRDSVGTITKEGKRNFIRAKKPSGKFYNLRSWFSIFYLVVFFSLPFIKVNNNPLIMMNILQRKFILFGLVFWPQDFFIFGVGMVTFIVFVILFTVVFGRVFCGWACPQTIFMEMVFRKIEYWIDGDATQQKLLQAMPWNINKIKKDSSNSCCFFSFHFL